ncbi:hypothetical protein A2783_05015 [Microgenomates group bacterium RIFCSPHIGHO2_01_FULL_45_11]|nr:MAG: hypothetical protein A2783_05015 [Microgenomates group bacterium RIFCSPHIGHO2_01_FULL_45_11]
MRGILSFSWKRLFVFILIVLFSLWLGYLLLLLGLAAFGQVSETSSGVTVVVVTAIMLLWPLMLAMEFFPAGFSDLLIVGLGIMGNLLYWWLLAGFLVWCLKKIFSRKAPSHEPPFR